MVGVGQSVERKISPGGIKQPMLRMNREERSNVPPQRMGRPNGNDSGASDKNEDPHDHGNGPNENGGPGGNRDLPDRRPPRGNGNPGGGDGGSDPDDSGDGDDSGSPNMFMCYRDLQDRQTRKDNLDKQEEMGKHCHWLEP